MVTELFSYGSMRLLGKTCIESLLSKSLVTVNIILVTVLYSYFFSLIYSWSPDITDLNK